MSKEDIDKAVKEAEQYAAEDKKKREEVRYAATTPTRWCSRPKRRMGEFGDKVSASDENRA